LWIICIVQRIGDQSSLISGGSRRLFWNSTSQKGLFVSVISTRLIIRFLSSTTHSRVPECGWWALLSVFLTMQGKVNTESYSQEKSIFYKVANIITPVETCKVWWRTRRQETTRRVGMCHTSFHNTVNWFSNVRCERDFLIERLRCSPVARFDLFNTSFISSNTVVNAANVSIYCSEFVPVDTSR
jgi:hypothetical protein